MDNYSIVATHEALRKRLLDYIKTAYLGKNDTLRELCQDSIESQGVIWQEAYIEANPAYVVNEDGIAKSSLISEVKEILTKMSEYNLGVYKKPYLHQINALEQFYQGKDLFVATGTGSGKTECFLWPMVSKLVLEARTSSHTWSQRGVRAVILYPMNALVADQVGRLRKIIGDRQGNFKEVFNTFAGRQRRPQFGMYTGRTPYAGEQILTKDKDLASTLQKNLMQKDSIIQEQLINMGKYPAKADLQSFINGLKEGNHITNSNDAELFTRFEMHKNCPDILITNYSMLEYMLMRKIEQGIWNETRKWLEMSKDNKLLFIIDEAHMYRGASGGEVALLIRRFMHKLGIDRDRIQFILTSASIPSYSDDDIQRFANELSARDPINSNFTIIKGEQEKLNYDGVKDIPAKILENFSEDSLQSEPIQRLQAIKEFGELVGFDNEKCSFTDEKEVEQWLYSQLRTFAPMLRIMETCRGKATKVIDLAKRAFPNDKIELAIKATSKVLSIATLAKNADGQVLFPSRIHMMFRGLQGIYACINPNCSMNLKKTNLNLGKVYLGAHEDICKCGGKIFELLNDRTCGALFIKGYIDESEPSKKFVWSKSGLINDNDFKEVHFYIIPSDLPYVKPKRNRDIHIGWLNGITGCLELDDSHADYPHYIRVAYCTKTSKEEPDTYTFNTCPKCNKHNLKVTDFATKGNEPFFNLVSEQLMIQPPVIHDEELLENNPNAGRKVLLFSDSRQRAAILAKELTSVADEEAMKKAITVAAIKLQKWAKENNKEPTMDILYVAFLQVAYEHKLRFFYGDDEIELHDALEKMKKEYEKAVRRGRRLRYDSLRDTTFANIPELYSKYLLKHLCSNFRSLTDLGLCWVEPCNEDIMDNIFDDFYDTDINMNEDEFIALFSAWCAEIMTDSYAYDHNVNDEVRKSITKIPRYGLNKNKIIPTRYSKLLKEVGYTDEKINVIAASLFRFTQKGDNGNYFINPKVVTLQYGLDKRWYKCPQCGRVFPYTLWGRCALCCKGEPVEMDNYGFERVKFWREPVIAAIEGERGALMTRINTEEHTAQLSHKDQRMDMWSTTEEFEMRFQNVDIDEKGPVDILSCTTTMEVGIDIGSLTAVGLRNIPPMRENYQQRAGRAGRRSSAISTIVTYTDNGPHDSYYFYNPERIITGEPRVPCIDIDNAKLIYRHLNVIFITDYLNKYNTGADEIGVIDFMKNYINEFIDYINLFKFSMRQIKCLIPEQKREIIGTLKDELIKAIIKLKQSVLEFEENYIGTEGEEKKLLDVLLEEGIFPTYSFPRNVVGFYIEKNNENKVEQVPERSLDLAINEYAPGRLIVVNKKTYKSGGIYSFHSKFMKTGKHHPARRYFENIDYYRPIYYCSNNTCNWYGFKEPRGGICPFCRQESIKSQHLLKPWGFAPINGKSIKEAEAEAEMSYAETPSYGSPIRDEDMIQSMDYSGLRYAKLTDQPLIVLNKGPMKDGFTICQECGAAVPGDDIESLKKIQQPYNHPYVYQKCYHPSDRIVNTFIGHQLLTDMVLLEISIDPRVVNTTIEGMWIKSAAQTLAEAIVLAAGQLLDIEFNDIKSGYRIRYGIDKVYVDIFLFDSLSSGAGYSSLLANKTTELLNKTYEILCCSHNCESACHDCLKHYWNQRGQDILDRFSAMELLNWGKDQELAPTISYDNKAKLIAGLQELALLDGDFNIIHANDKIYVKKDRLTKELVIYPAMWNRDNPNISPDAISISDKMIKYALPKAYSMIRHNL